MTCLLSPVTSSEQPQLQALYIEIKPYFMTIEGRNPLSPFDDIATKIPGIPVEKTHCLSIHTNDQVVGYIWVFEETPTNLYILHLSIGRQFRRHHLGQTAITALVTRYPQMTTFTLMASTKNYSGLKFWLALGFSDLLYVEAPDENAVTSTVELELRKHLRPL
ncbi:GNAT family N-acetyltransferase [Levilactobacillus fujinensis]|uniref:GNAT family N-acetyltransferase n=2 Tax=Levilactobacillus fujinensis TaxID=2486024 RepID=A0ABW1THS0_9LACO|nr:GNAT family N-acetyltransferase [Levilactobacillus fujinensis]